MASPFPWPQLIDGTGGVLTAGALMCINTHGMSSKEIIRLLQKHGWVMDRSKGSHHQFKHPSRPGLVTVPHPKKDLPTGTARAILKSAGLERNK